MDLAVIAPVIGAMAMAVVGILYWLILKEDAGTEKMKEIASFIQEGANAFLKRQFKTILYFIAALVVILLIAFWPRWQIAFGFLVGGLLSQLAIFIGMNAAVRANVRTTNAARTSAGKALTLAFRGGAIMGLTIVALNLLGISLLYFLFGGSPTNPAPVSLLVGFGFGASLSAIFAQLGGGIYTKAADIGADLVGKIEVGIPEDDPRNPAVIADQVGDNVGDCAGRGADLFESGSDNLVATMIVGLAFLPVYGYVGILFPLLTRSIGSLGTIIGTFMVREEARNPIRSLNIGIISAGIFSLISFYFLANWVMNDINLFYCLALGLFAALAVTLIVQYYTGINWGPVKEIAEAAEEGAAIDLMAGFSYGLESVFFPILVIAGVTIASYLIAGGGLFGVYGIAAAALGITEMKGIIMASDTFGPITDNASGISEMAGLKKEITGSLHVLDAAGNVTKAITKGYAMACALLTAVLILFAYLSEATRLEGIQFTDLAVVATRLNLVQPINIVALMLGATIPFLFSGLCIQAVGRTAMKMVNEVRRQFREIPGLLEGKANPDYSTCVDISTKSALRGMIPPVLVGLMAPIIVGFVLGIWALAAFLIAVTIMSAILATFMFNAGAEWDNAKKYIEEGHLGGKGTQTYAASVIGDTFGDPLKDTAGPSLHVLIKLESILAITLLPLFITYALVQ
ncbi:MAG: sodium-translocating pyrophosphatase [Candidatus Bathyarchaeia archaeon]